MTARPPIWMVLSVLAVWYYVFLPTVNTMPLPFKIVAWVGGFIIAVWSVAQAVEYFHDKYKRFGPGWQSAAHGWWMQSPWKSTLVIALCGGVLFAALSAAAFYYWAKHPVATVASKSSDNPTLQSASLESLIQEVSLRNANQSFPGMSLMMLIKWGHQIKDRRQYIFDTGIPDRERLALYVSPDNVLTLFFVDTRGEPHVIQAPVGPDVLPVDRWVHLYCEVGSGKGSTKVRMLVNGNEVAKVHLPYNTDTGKLSNIDNFVLAADLNHQNNGVFSVQHVAVWSVTLTHKEVDKIVAAAGLRK